MKKIMMRQNDVVSFMETIKTLLLGDKGLPEKLNLDVNPSVKLKEEDKAEILFENEAFKKMNALVQNCGSEIGWFGTVERISEKQFLIKDIIMFPQEVTGATVQEDESGDTDWRDELSDEAFNALRFYGHSHVKMCCTPSTTDTDHYKSMIQNVQDFYIFGIFNKNATNNYWFNIYDIANNVLYEKDDIIYKYLITPEDEWAEEQIKKFVKEKVVTPANVANYSGYYSPYYSNYKNPGTNSTAANPKKEEKKEDKDKKDKKSWDGLEKWNKKWKENYPGCQID